MTDEGKAFPLSGGKRSGIFFYPAFRTRPRIQTGRTLIKPWEIPMALWMALVVSDSFVLCLFFGEIFHQFVLQVTRHEFVACKLHDEAGASSGE